MKLNAIAVILFRKELLIEDFVKYFDYNHSYIKSNKKTLPLAMAVNLNDIEKHGVTKFAICGLDDKGIKLKNGSLSQQTIDYDQLLNKLKEVPHEVIDGKKKELSISQFKAIKSFKDFVDYLKQCSELSGLEVKYFGHCSAPNECIVGRIEGICRKCEIMLEAEFDAIGKETFKV